MGGTGVIDNFLGVFTSYIDSGFGLLGGEVAFIATTLIVIDVVLAELFWSWGADDDLAAEVARYKAAQLEEVEAEPASPPGPPPKFVRSRAGRPANLPAPKSVRRPPLKRRHSVKLPFRKFPPQVVSDLMTRKLIAIGEEESFEDIENGMKEYRLRHFPVVDSQNKLVGLVSWEDVMLASSSSLSAEREKRDELIHRAVKAKDVMRRDVLSVRPDDGIADAGNVMVLKQLHRSWDLY